MQIEVAPLQDSDLDEGHRIFNLAFGTFLGAPDPATFFGDRDLFRPRFRSPSTAVLAARGGGRLLGSNVLTRWGSFGFFGPLTVLPEYWDRGVAKSLLEETVGVFEQWGVRHSGLFTFPHSAKHVGLYQKFGYWPQYLTAVMKKTPQAEGESAARFSGLDETGRERTLRAARELTDGISPGLDLDSEIRAVFEQGLGDTVVVQGEDGLDAFAVCHTGSGSEGGSGQCYIKFGAARGGTGAGERFDRLLAACEAFAAERGVELEAGVNLAREDAYRRMRARGYFAATQGVAMQRPHEPGFNRGDVYVMDDWR
jgi:GNAT superfamily N-acetyltransferase